ncbi:MAG: hypothetical protein LUB56_00140 [Coprobacillus sp.]|nr:hypothetical protein [Coprobacillus sp.]
MSGRDRKNLSEDANAKTRHNCKITAIVFAIICGVCFFFLIFNGILSWFVNDFAYGDEAYATTQTVWMFIFVFVGLFAIALALASVDWDARNEEKAREKKEKEEIYLAKLHKERSKSESLDPEEEFWGSNRDTPDDEMFRLSMWDMLDGDDPNDDD